MAHVVEILNNQTREGLISRAIQGLRSRIHRRRVYARTYAELSNLSTRELDDLGISRSMISRLAYEAANQK